VGTISVSTTKMTFNSTTKTYRIILQADVPIYNPNYLKVGWGGGCCGCRIRNCSADQHKAGASRQLAHVSCRAAV
jgi:hypothetical protein